MAFVSSLDKVTVASRTVAVLAFAGRGFAGLWRGPGWAELPFSQGSALVLLAVSTLPHSPFVSLSPGCQDAHKFTFLKSVYVLCKTALKRGLTQGLDLFCQTCEVVENIKVRGHLVFWGWGQAPLAPAPCVDSAWVGQGLEALGASSCQLPSWLCSAGHPGKGAKGPSVLTGPLSRHDCHR